MKTTCPICKGSGKLPVTRQPKAESHGVENRKTAAIEI
jgi:hypothetical protein